MTKSLKTFKGVRTAVHAMLPDGADGYTRTQLNRTDSRKGDWSGVKVSWSAHIKFTIRHHRLGEFHVEALVNGEPSPARLLRKLKRKLKSDTRRAMKPSERWARAGQQMLLLDQEE